MSRRVHPGKSFPPGATVYEDGINFSVFSVNAAGIEVLLFESQDSPEPCEVIRLNEPQHRTYHYWHVFVPGLASGQVYAYRAYGPFDPALGLRFDGSKVLVDPYGKFIVGWESY